MMMIMAQILSPETTFGGEGGGKGNPYGSGESQTAYDMATYMNGKYAGRLPL
jgi:hypothetical protein